MTVGLKVRDAADGVLVNQNSGSTYLVNSSVLLEANYEIPIAKELLLLFLSEERFDILYTYCNARATMQLYSALVALMRKRTGSKE